jgi:ATP-dependent DNA helicase PIF1
VFFTRAAGTGKSVLMKLMIARLRGTYKENPEKLAVTASTGLAACHIGGITLYSWGGVGLGKDNVNKLVKNIRRNQNAIKRWRETEILIIDEISIIDGALFDKMESIARRLRPKRKNQPFGGIQLVIIGDFF